MSYLAQVLSSAEKVEIDHINSKCPEVSSEVAKCKSEVLTFLDDIYVRFLERPRKNKALASKVNRLQEDISGLINNVQHLTHKELSKAETKLESHLDALSQINISISLVATVCNVHEALIEINQLTQNYSYLKCMEKILDTEREILGLNLDENLPVINEMTLQIWTEKSSLLDKLSNVVKDNVILLPGENKSVLKIGSESEVMEDVLSALYYYKTAVLYLDNVTRFLWNSIFVPVVDTTTEVRTSTENDFALLEVVTVDPNKKSSYEEVFANITIILEFLLANFNIRVSGDFTTLDYIGRDIRDNLSELIIKHCLQDTIPSTKEGLEQYKIVITATEELEKTLVSSKIFAKDTTSILEYANNIDVLFINKKCQDYLLASQQLMKRDLHDLVEVGTETESLDSSDAFPRCSISKNVVDLLNLLEKILIQAATSSEVCAGRLFCTVKNICQKYMTFVPEHHKKFLQTIPQQIALFYNNCNYMSHRLSEWNSTHLTRLPSLLSIGPVGFEDEGRRLREIASDKFTTFVESQIRQIQDIMKDSGFERRTLEQLDSGCEKAVRQCLRQQELLKTVWSKVLPYTTYNKTLGAILNSLCLNLVSTIVKFEDISSDAAEQLVEMFKMVQTRGPKLFTDPKEVTLFVPSWYKMNEVAFVLNASLLDINDRWADGKGPLALQFKAEELRQLVRALFQNTERRAALLAKIYD